MLAESFVSAPLFDRTDEDRAFVPTGFSAAVARSGGPGRPSGRRGRASPWRAASTTAVLLRIGALALCFCAGVVGSGAQAEALADAAPLAGLVSEASLRFGLPERWIWAVMNAESAFDPRAVSRAGAVGLMQIMPATYAELARRHRLGTDPFAARDNVAAGAAYLRELYDRFGAPGFLAAYNAGPDRYLAWLATGRPLPAETRAYVARLAPAIAAMGPDMTAAPTEAAPSIFARVGAAHDGVPAASDQLFVAVSRPEETP